jgi:hypothetical protein
MLLKFTVGTLRKEQSRSFISSSSFDYRFNVVGSYKQETLKLRSFILRFSRIHLVNRYRSGFHRTRRLHWFSYPDIERSNNSIQKKIIISQSTEILKNIN